MKKVAMFLLLLTISPSVFAADRPAAKAEAKLLPKCVLLDNAHLLRRRDGVPEGNYQAEVFIDGWLHAKFEASSRRPYEGTSFPSNVSELVTRATDQGYLLVSQARRNAEVEIRLLVLEGKCRN